MLERRVHRRYSLPENELFAVDRNTSGFAAVRDISLGGLKVEYIHGSDLQDRWTLIDINSRNNHGAWLSSICCRLIYDISDLSQQRTFTGQETRICGLNFSELTAEQEEVLCQLLSQ